MERCQDSMRMPYFRVREKIMSRDASSSRKRILVHRARTQLARNERQQPQKRKRSKEFDDRDNDPITMMMARLQQRRDLIRRCDVTSRSGHVFYYVSELG
jgi:hypothetical protein